MAPRSVLEPVERSQGRRRRKKEPWLRYEVSVPVWALIGLVAAGTFTWLAMLGVIPR